MELLKFDLRMLPYSITLFVPYANLNSSDDGYKAYKDYYIPTIIDNVYYEVSKTYNTVNSGASGLGDYTLVIPLQQSKFYRYIDNVKTNVEYIENVLYTNKGYDEQATKYFTIRPNDCYFILGYMEKYNNDVKIIKSEIAVNNKNLLQAGKERHTISSIDKSGLNYLLSITGRIA